MALLLLPLTNATSYLYAPNGAVFLGSIWNSRVAADPKMCTNSVQNSQQKSNQELNIKLKTCLVELQQEVLQWIVTPLAWDERKHPAILQFLKDINDHCAGLRLPGSVTISAIEMELERLNKKIPDPKVRERIIALYQVIHGEDN